MIEFKNQVAQGDILFTKIDALPSNAQIQKPSKDKHIVAHSETGHHHVMSSKDVDFYASSNDEFVCYLVVHNKTTLKHNRSFDTHAPISFEPGIYRVNRQREYTPEGFRRAAD